MSAVFDACLSDPIVQTHSGLQGRSGEQNASLSPGAKETSENRS